MYFKSKRNEVTFNPYWRSTCSISNEKGHCNVFTTSVGKDNKVEKPRCKDIGEKKSNTKIMLKINKRKKFLLKKVINDISYFSLEI